MNQLTHKIAIPLIVFQIVAMLNWIPLFETPYGLITVAHPAFLAVVIWYFTLAPLLAPVMALLYGICFPIAAITPVWVVVLAAIVGWTIQLLGHSVWEKRRPAFLTNALQALVGPLYFVAVFLGVWPRSAS